MFEINKPPRGELIEDLRYVYDGAAELVTLVPVRACFLYTTINLKYVDKGYKTKWTIFVDFHKVLASRWRVAIQSTNPDNAIGKPCLFLSAILTSCSIQDFV